MISDEAVEAAAREIDPLPWSDNWLHMPRTRQERKDTSLKKARAALEAALPHLLASQGCGTGHSGEQLEPAVGATAALAFKSDGEATESDYWRDRRERMEAGETPYNSDYVDEFPQFGRF